MKNLWHIVNKNSKNLKVIWNLSLLSLNVFTHLGRWESWLKRIQLDLCEFFEDVSSLVQSYQFWTGANKPTVFLNSAFTEGTTDLEVHNDTPQHALERTGRSRDYFLDSEWNILLFFGKLLVHKPNLNLTKRTSIHIHVLNSHLLFPGGRLYPGLRSKTNYNLHANQLVPV